MGVCEKKKNMPNGWRKTSTYPPPLRMKNPAVVAITTPAYALNGDHWHPCPLFVTVARFRLFLLESGWFSLCRL